MSALESNKKQTQLELGLAEPLANKFFYVRGKISHSLRIFETKKFIRSWVLWFSIIFSITLIFIQGFYLFSKYSTLPDVVPLLKMFLTLERTLVSKETLFALPMSSITIFIGSLYVTSVTYNKNSHAALSILIINTIAIGLLTFNLIQLIAQYNV